MMRADSYLKKAMAGHYGPQARQDAQSVVEQAATSGYAHDAERIVRDLSPDPRRAAEPADHAKANPGRTAPAIDTGWLSELLELSDTQSWRDGTGDAQARFVSEMLPRRNETLNLEYRVTLSVGIARWAASHGYLEAALAVEDFQERLAPAMIADALNQLDEVQIDDVGFNVEDSRAVGWVTPDGELDAAARALFEACEIGFQRWDDLTEDCQQVMRQRAQRVVDAFQGRTRSAGAPSQGYTTGRRCQACRTSYEECVSRADEYFEWSKGRDFGEVTGPSAPPQSCCPSCQFPTQERMHDIVVVEPESDRNEVL